MLVLKVKVISLPYIFQVLYVLCFTRLRYKVSAYRTIGPLVIFIIQNRVRGRMGSKDLDWISAKTKQ